MYLVDWRLIGSAISDVGMYDVVTENHPNSKTNKAASMYLLVTTMQALQLL